MKLGRWEIPQVFQNWTWTRNRIIAVAVAGAVVLLGIGVMIGKNGSPKVEQAEEVPPYPVEAQLSPQAKKEADFMARGAMMATFFHESGHMLITELNLPAVGPEEDVVDEFSTFFLTDMEKAAPDNLKPMFANIVVAGALQWKLSAAEHDIKKFPFYDEHAPDERRFFNILCIATGADPLRFIPLAVKNGVPQERLEKCAAEYTKKHEAWETLIGPHRKSWLGRSLHTGGHLHLVVGPVGKSEWLPFELTWRQGGFFQQILDGMSGALDLPEDIGVEIKTCNGTINAWWAKDEKKITICHELFAKVNQQFSALYAGIEQAQQQQQGAPGGQEPQPAPGGQEPVPGGGQPVPAPAPQGGNAVAFLTGRWICNVVDPRSGMHGISDTQLGADGQFRTVQRAQTGLTSTGWGSWSAQGSNIIRYDFEGVSPTQFCGQNGCVPNTVQTPYFVTYRVLSPTAIRLPQATCNKAG